ncbi:RloB family protein [Shewanella bicestrii]|uniref:RloB family protein n=1 Tax=Shewanella seohaensis TaxID=755175 RepID=A0ABV4VTV4_9GAMM
MGSDDLFRKLREKSNKNNRRDRTKKESYDKFLIVCEDTVSGYQYLSDAIKYYKISNANVSIVGLGQSPLNIVDHALEKFEAEGKSHRSDFDRVYCVFDRDEHTNFFHAIKKLESLNKKLNAEIFFAITSDPCFEIWLLLHFRYTSKLYERTAKKSAANIVQDDLKKILHSYSKSSKTAFNDTIVLLDIAIKNALLLRQYCEDNSAITPKTDMHVIMSFIKEQNEKIYNNRK